MIRDIVWENIIKNSNKSRYLIRYTSTPIILSLVLYFVFSGKIKEKKNRPVRSQLVNLRLRRRHCCFIYFYILYLRVYIHNVYLYSIA